jgi:hypothetical protein
LAGNKIEITLLGTIGLLFFMAEPGLLLKTADSRLPAYLKLQTGLNLRFEEYNSGVWSAGVI